MKIVIFSLFFIFSISLIAQSGVKESQVDYIEQIYFSGQNQAGLLQLIQNFENAFEAKKIEVTNSTAGQASFLINSNPYLVNTSNSCEILDILASGIYFLDSNEAKRQGVNRPSAKTLETMKTPLANVNKNKSDILTTASNSAQKINNITTTTTSLIGSASSIAAPISNAAGNMLGAVSLASQFVSLGQALGIGVKKDKPCKSVKPKQIGISDRTKVKMDTTSTNLLIISFNNTSYNDLRQYYDYLKANKDVVYITKTYSQNRSSMAVTNKLNTDAIYDLLIKKFPNMKLASMTENTLEFNKP